VAAEAHEIRKEVVIAASRETVWQFLIDPDKAVRWMGRTAQLDARVGGVYRVDVIPGSVAIGHFVEVDPPRRLVYTWGWELGSPRPLPPGSTTVVIELTPHAEGTLLQLRHTGLPADDTATGHARGWDHYLARLRVAAAGADPGVDPWIATPPPFLPDRSPNGGS